MDGSEHLSAAELVVFYDQLKAFIIAANKEDDQPARALFSAHPDQRKLATATAQMFGFLLERWQPDVSVETFFDAFEPFALRSVLRVMAELDED